MTSRSPPYGGDKTLRAAHRNKNPSLTVSFLYLLCVCMCVCEWVKLTSRKINRDFYFIETIRIEYVGLGMYREWRKI